jgi:DNA-directed RNA polymerase specialized sigma24 family protein
LTIAIALERLERENPRQIQVVRCRFLLGMTAAETAAALRIGTRTVEREWQEARARLSCKLDPVRE